MTDQAERERLARWCEIYAESYECELRSRDVDMPEAIARARDTFRAIATILRAPAVPEGWRTALEQALDRMQMIQDYKDGKSPMMPSCSAAIEHAKEVLAAAPQPKEPNDGD